MESIPLPDAPEVYVEMDQLKFMADSGQEQYHSSQTRGLYRIRDLLAQIGASLNSEEEMIAHILRVLEITHNSAASPENLKKDIEDILSLNPVIRPSALVIDGLASRIISTS